LLVSSTIPAPCLSKDLPLNLPRLTQPSFTSLLVTVSGSQTTYAEDSADVSPADKVALSAPKAVGSLVESSVPAVDVVELDASHALQLELDGVTLGCVEEALSLGGCVMATVYVVQ
jgi:hypothetical protein